MPIAAAILVTLVVAAVVGAASVFGTPILALPVLAVIGVVWGTTSAGRRLLGRAPRERGRVEFTAEDRETLLPAPSKAERQENRRRAAAQT
jgi:hypothetical protein